MKYLNNYIIQQQNKSFGNNH